MAPEIVAGSQDAEQPRRIAVVGLGQMGLAMALALRDAGWQVVGFDASPTARERATEELAVTEDFAGLAGVDTFLVSVPGAAHVRDVVSSVLTVSPGAVIIDTTTSEPATSAELAQQANAVGSAFVDAPVSGGKSGARAGTLMAFVGGSVADVARAQPVLDAIAAGKWRHLGAPGAGNVGKLVNNTLAAMNLVIAAEALAIGQQWGIAPADLVDALNGASGRNAATEVNLPRWVLPETFDSGFTMALMVRDVNLALQTFQQEGIVSPVTELVVNRWNEAAQQLAPGDDFNRVVPVLAAAARGNS